MSFKAKLIVFSRYGLSVAAAFLMQAIFFKVINEITNKKVKKIIKILFFLFNSLILILPIDFIMHLTINQVVFRTILIIGIFYQIITALFIFIFIISRTIFLKYLPKGNKILSLRKQGERRAFILGSTMGLLFAIPILNQSITH